MKRVIGYLAALMLIILPVISSAECKHEVEPSEWILRDYVDPQPGIPGYSGDLCCPVCGAVMKKGEAIGASADPDEEEKKENEQEDPIPVPVPVDIGAEAPGEGGLIWSPDMETEGESSFTVPNSIPAKGIEDFIGEWHYFRIVNEDGSEMSREEMLAEGLIYDYAEIIITKDEIQLFAPSLNDSASIEVEFDPEDGSLKILNGSEELPVLRLADNGMLILFVPAYNTSSGDTTAYLTRWKP